MNFFTDVEFRGFQQSLDAEMKPLRGEGIGVTRKRAEPISVKEKGELWEKGILGDSSPQVLLFSIKCTVLPSINTVVASKTVSQLGALVEHMM